MLYINGAAGNIAPIYSVYPNPSAGHLGQFRVLLGNRILEAEQQIKPVAGRVRIRAVEKTISTPMRAGLEWPDELSRYAKPGSTTVDLPVRLLAINDLAIWAAPVELFCEISMRIRKESPFPQTFYFGYANGWLGYLPTAEGFAEGGYEPKTSVLTKDAEGDITRRVLAALKELRQQ